MILELSDTKVYAPSLRARRSDVLPSLLHSGVNLEWCDKLLTLKTDQVGPDTNGWVLLRSSLGKQGFFPASYTEKVVLEAPGAAPPECRWLLLKV